MQSRPAERAARIAAFFAAATLLGQASTSSAQSKRSDDASSQTATRRVAVVNVATDQVAGEVATRRVRHMLEELPPLAPLPAGNLARALEAPLPPSPEALALQSAARALARADAYAQAMALSDAALAIDSAEGELLPLAPSHSVRATLSEINVQRGVVAMGEANRGRAVKAFRLARLLDPSRTALSASDFDPEVLKTFRKAGAALPKDGVLEISTSYDNATLFVDGVRVHSAKVAVSPGFHLVTANFTGHRGAGTRVEVRPGQTQTIKLQLWPELAETRARALRREVLETEARTTDDTDDLRPTVQGVSSLTGADAVVLVRVRTARSATATSSETEVAVFDQRDHETSGWMRVGSTAPRTLFTLLLPQLRITRIPDGPIKIPPPPPPPPPPPWFRQRKWQAIAGSGAALTILGIVVFSATRGGDEQTTGGTLGGPGLWQ